MTGDRITIKIPYKMERRQVARDTMVVRDDGTVGIVRAGTWVEVPELIKPEKRNDKHSTGDF